MGVPAIASLFMLLKKVSLFKERPWTSIPFETLGATYVSAFRSPYVEDDEFMGKLCYYYLQQTLATGPGPMFMGTDGPAANVNVPIVATANMNHLGGGGTPAQAIAAMQAEMHDTMFGASGRRLGSGHLHRALHEVCAFDAVLKHCVKSKLKWLLLLSTPWKFNISPENKPSQTESNLPTIIFQGFC